MEIGKISLKSSFDPLQDGFDWAKQQALSFIHHDNDPVGLWYEAALPHREAFCLRDVAHQCNGAFFLGLKDFNKNMLKKFAQNISESKDFCTYWEINRHNQPAPVDYKSDQDFWYNLPANFDFIDCCLRQYHWTGDLDYVQGEEFANFYQLSLHEYIDRWDTDGDGIPKKQGSVHYRGIPSYLESHVGKNGIYVGSDLIAALFAAYKAYSTILQIRGDSTESAAMEQKATELQKRFNREWWSEKDGMYYSSVLQDGTKNVVDIHNIGKTIGELTPMPLYFNIVQGLDRKELFLQVLKDAARNPSLVHRLTGHRTINVENLSILPEIFYAHGDTEAGFATLMQLMDSSLKRRDYPEVSFSAVGAVMTGLMGLHANAYNRTITLQPILPVGVDWVEIQNIPLWGGTLNLRVCQKEMTVETIFKGKREIITATTGKSCTIQL